MSFLSRYRTFLLDLDDTLYLERDFVLSGLDAVAQALGKDGLDERVVRDWLHRQFLSDGRDHIFNKCLRQFGRNDDPATIEQLVSIYRHHAPQIALLPGVADVLDEMKRHGEIVIVTDGLPLMQQNKTEALGLQRWASRLFYCWEHDTPKPDVSVLGPLVTRLPGPVLMVGDNPGHDLCIAERIGVDAVRIRQGRFAGLNSEPWRPIREIHHLSDLLG